MRHAIGYALHWPDRRNLPVDRLDLAQIGSLTFKTPDAARYPALRLAARVMEARGLSGAVFNGAKERALDAFIAGRIGFLQMAEVVERVLDELSARPGLIDATMTLDIVAQTDHLAREQADIVMKNLDG
jgi:1-deoxy-D-xylulose-5-phosphate reductoisomerase